MSQTDLEQEIRRILASKSVGWLSVTTPLIALLDQQSEAAKIDGIKILIENFGLIKRTEASLPEQKVGENEWASLVIKHREYVQAVLNRALQANPASRDFAAAINKLLGEVEPADRRFVLAVILRHDRIPYFQFPALAESMPEEEFGDRMRKLRKEVTLIRYVFQSEILSVIDAVRRIYPVMRDIPDKRDQFVLLTVALSEAMDFGKKLDKPE